MKNKEFYNNIKKIAIPITLQSIFQAVLSLIDQVMIGNLGNASIAGIGLASKFISLFTVVVSAVVTVAGILIAQYMGNKNKDGVNSSFFSNLYFAFIISIGFILLSLSMPNDIMSLYSEDTDTIRQAVIYLRIMTLGFIPQTITLMFSALLRNMNCAKTPMVASAVAVVTNTVFNYLLIFGIGIFPKLEVGGAALATSISRIIELLIILFIYFRIKDKRHIKLKITYHFNKSFLKKIGYVLVPILLCEFLWSLGENVYAIIYGHIGTESCAAMTLTYPLQTFAIGALSGVSAAAGIIIGQSLGAGDYNKAYKESKKLIKLTLGFGIVISVLVSLFAGLYVKLYNTEVSTSQLTIYILYAYSVVFCAKTLNMVLGGGIIRSGGKTKYVLITDIIGTWMIGVPLGYITAYICKLPIHYVYLILSMEEYIRLLIEIYIFKSKAWMINITTGN